MTDGYGALATYIKVLSESADATHHAEDRPTYLLHLAAAARMFAAIHGGALDDLRRLVDEERHGYGWGFLSGDEGNRTEAAFAAFAESIDRGLSTAQLPVF